MKSQGVVESWMQVRDNEVTTKDDPNTALVTLHRGLTRPVGISERKELPTMVAKTRPGVTVRLRPIRETVQTPEFCAMSIPAQLVYFGLKMSPAGLHKFNSATFRDRSGINLTVEQIEDGANELRRAGSGHVLTRRNGRPYISAKVRAAVYERDGHCCVVCGSSKQISLDHIHPYSMGGADTVENLQTMCRPCNSSKGARA